MLKRLIAPLLLVALVGVALIATAGDGSRGDATSPGPAVPDLSVAHLDGNSTFALAGLADREQPTLLWFWAPWCEICNNEAPGIDQLAAEAVDELTVIAIGGRDQAANGRAFVDRHDLQGPTLLFDEPMAAWNAYSIPGQPVGVLLDHQGRERQRWLGAFDPADVLAAARTL